MNWDAIGAVGEWVGGIGVVVTLAFLVAQVRQNAVLMRRIEQNATVQEWSALRRLLMSDAEIVRLRQIGSQDPASLTDVDKERLATLHNELLWLGFQMWQRANDGLLDHDAWRRFLPVARGLLETPFGRAWWAVTKDQFPAEFVAELDRRVGSSAAS